MGIGEGYDGDAGTVFPEDIGDALRFINEHYGSRRNVRELRVGDLAPGDGVRSRPFRVAGESLAQRLTREKDEIAEAILVLAGQLARRERQIAHMDRYPADDPFPDGTKLEFEKRFPGSEQRYSYLALRAGGTWHVTGRRSPQNVRWSTLVEFMGLGVDTVFKIGPKGGRKKVIG